MDAKTFDFKWSDLEVQSILSPFDWSQGLFQQITFFCKKKRGGKSQCSPATLIMRFVKTYDQTISIFSRFDRFDNNV